MKSLRHAVALIVPAVLALGAAVALLVLGTARRVVTPGRRAVDTVIRAVDTGAQTIELQRTPDTELPGRYGLFTTGTHGYVKLGAVLSADATTVRRKLLTQIEPGADIGGGASIMGTLSGGGAHRVSIGARTLLGANAGIGISLGDDCIVEAGLYVTAGTKIVLSQEPPLHDGSRPVVKGAQLSGQNSLLFRRNSLTGAVEAVRREGVGVTLNEALHA